MGYGMAGQGRGWQGRAGLMTWHGMVQTCTCRAWHGMAAAK